MTAPEKWSWADVPGLDTQAGPPTRRRSQSPRGRPKHPVTLGQHDETILSMARRGELTTVIASILDCSDSLVVRRLRALGVDG